MFGCIMYWKRLKKSKNRTQQSNVQTNAVEAITERERDLNFTAVPGGLCHTQPLNPVTIECPSKPPLYSSANNQQPSINHAQLSSGEAPPSYDAALSFPNVPVITGKSS